jgi:hypothetical protein
MMKYAKNADKNLFATKKSTDTMVLEIFADKTKKEIL